MEKFWWNASVWGPMGLIGIAILSFFSGRWMETPLQMGVVMVLIAGCLLGAILFRGWAEKIASRMEARTETRIERAYIRAFSGYLDLLEEHANRLVWFMGMIFLMTSGFKISVMMYPLSDWLKDTMPMFPLGILVGWSAAVYAAHRISRLSRR